MDCLKKCREWREPLSQLSSNTTDTHWQNVPKATPKALEKDKSFSVYQSVIPTLGEPDLSLKNANWYWGDISRNEVNEKLLGTPDGSFLVRNSANVSSDYTVTVKKGGRNKLIKITQKDGKYGFSEPFQFNSVAELIDYYRSVSLSVYNPSLDVKLLFPISRNLLADHHLTEEQLGTLKIELIVLNKLFYKKNRKYNDYSEKAEVMCSEIEEGHRNLEAFKKTINLFRKQIKLHENIQKEAEPHEINLLKSNFQMLKERCISLNYSKGQLCDKVNRLEMHLKKIQNEMHTLETELVDLMKTIDLKEARLVSRGEKIENIRRLAQGRLSYGKHDVYFNHNNESTWMAKDFSRERAEQVLTGRKNGTFLIRPSKSGQYALSIVCDGRVCHCKIFKTDKGYGFAEPYNIYKSLNELVLNYYHDSLEQHNDLMHTTLAIPAFAGYDYDSTKSN